MPFIKQYHADEKYIFLSDKASSNYSKLVVNWTKENGLKMIPKVDNSTNIPQTRPIRNLWGLLSAKMYEGELSCDTLEKLKARIL